MSKSNNKQSAGLLCGTRLKWTVLFSIVSILVKTLIPELLLHYFPTPTPVVKISDGLVQGRVAYSRNGTEYYEFLGIPYAQPPVGKLRFLPPVYPAKWSGVKNVMRYPPMCAQVEWISTQRFTGIDDCLTISVAAPSFNATESKNGKLYPVLVNIPGGGFMFGGTYHYGPNYFMDTSSIVVVSINYRLGAQGFLNFAQSPEEYEEYPLPRGNMGLKDQVMALQWVQNNIIFFGGDPSSVTLYGQSAGGVSAHFHMLSTRSRGLFHRAILHSGTLLSPWAFTTKPRKVAEGLAKNLGCSLENKKELMQCLQSADPYEIALSPKWPLNPISERDIFVPSVETIITDDTFISQRPYDLFKNGNLMNIPLILGVNSGDGALALSFFDKIPEFVENVQANWTNIASHLVCFESLFPSPISEEIRRFYFPENTSFTENPKLFKERLAIMISDTMSFEGTYSTAQNYLQRNASASVRLFLYDYRSTGVPGFYSIYKAVRPGAWFPPEVMIPYSIVSDWIQEHVFGGKGAHEYKSAHTDELFLLWVLDILASFTFSKQDLEFSKAFVNFFVDFAKGKEETLSFRGVQWPNVKSDELESLPYMRFDEHGMGTMMPGPYSEGVQFWRNLGIRNFN